MPARREFTDHQIEYMHANCRTQMPKEIARALGLDAGVVYRYMHNNGIKMSRAESCRLRGQRRIGFTTYTAEEDQYIREHYLIMPIKAMANELGRSWTGIMARLRNMGLELPKEVREHNSKIGRFHPGHISHNTGKPLPEHIREKIKHTQFKPGNLPKNTLYDGALSIRADARGVPYKFIRVGLSRWESLARYNWRKAHGPIPHNHCIIYLDGDTLNCELSNLKLITRREHMLRNSIQNYPAEIKTAIHTLSRLNQKIRHAEKQD